jgi:hypothetical protein
VPPGQQGKGQGFTVGVADADAGQGVQADPKAAVA